MTALRDDDKIFKSIVCFFTIDMVNNLRSLKRAVKMLFQQITMFQNISLVRMRMIRCVEKHISSIAHTATAFPFMGFSACFSPRVAGQKWKGIATEMSFFAKRIRRQISSLSATALAQATRDFFWHGDITSLMGPSLLRSEPHVMPLQESLVPIFIKAIRFQGLFATTFTKTTIHALHGSRDRNGCQLLKGGV
jgi:hypothetical protein